MSVPGRATMTSATADSSFNVTLVWAAVSGATGYTVYYSTSSSLPVKNGSGVTALALGNVLTTTVNLSSNTNGTITYFSVSASNATGEGPVPTIAKNATPKGPPGAFPSAPTITYSSTGQPILAWSPPATVGYIGSLSYSVQDSSNGGVTWVTASATSPYTFSGRVPGVTYISRVVARNSATLTSTSAQVSGTPYTVPSAPQSVSAALSTTNANQVIVSFLAPASDGYNTIQRYTVTPSGAPTAAQSFSDASANLTNDGLGTLSVVVAGLNLNTSYTFSVRAVNAAGSSAAATTTKKTNTLPGSPTAIAAFPASTSEASITFNAPTLNGGFDITSYTVTPYVGDVSGTPVTGSQSPVIVTGLSASTFYTFKVQAVSLAGSGTASAASNMVLMPIFTDVPGDRMFTQPSLSALTSYVFSSVAYSDTAYTDVTVQPMGNGVVHVRSGDQVDVLTNINSIYFNNNRTVFILDPAFGSANSSLASAVANARSTGSDGDIILLTAGSFIGSARVTIDKALTIQGPTTGAPAVIGSTAAGYILYITCHNVTLNNITVDYSDQPSATTSGAYPLLVVYRTSSPPPGDPPTSTIKYINNFACNYVVFTNPFTKGTDPSGTLAASQRGPTLNLVDNGTFDHCTFASTFNFGLGLTACKNITVTNSTFNPCGWGTIGIFPSALTNVVAYTTSNINLSAASNVFNTMASITVRPTGSTSATTLPTQAVILMQPNSGEVGASDYPFTSGITGSPDVKLPSSMDYLYISDPSTSPANAGTTYASQARYLPAHRYLESSISLWNWYGYQFSTQNYLMEHRFNVSPLLNNIAANTVQFQLESDIPTDSQLSATANSGAVILSDDEGRSYVYNANISQALAKVAEGAPFNNLAIGPGAVSGDAAVPVQTVSAAPFTISSDEYVASAATLPTVRTRAWYVQSSADQDALLTTAERNAKNKPRAPTINSITPGATTLTVDWSDNAGARPTSHFNVIVDDELDGPAVTSPYTITGLVSGTSYSVTVQAINSYGSADVSQSATPIGIPGAPSEYDQVPGDQSLEVFWSAPADNGSAITGYKVYWSSGTPLVLDGSATMLPTVDANNHYSHPITGLTNSTAYEWSVSAINVFGEGPQSSRFMLASPANVPTVPLGVSAVAGNGGITVSWSPPDSNGGAAVTGYTVISSDGSQNNVATSPYTFTGLPIGSYTFTVVARNSTGPSDPSDPSNPVTLSTTPDAPTGVEQAPDTAGTSGTVTLNWTAPASNGGAHILSYNVYQTVGGIQSFAANITSGTNTTLTGLTDGSGYTFQVAAVNTNGEGARASSQPITPYQSVTLILDNLSQAYTGSALSATVSSAPAGAPISLSYSGDRIQVGSSCIVTASVTGSAFQGPDVSAVLVISKATATIDLSGLSQDWTGSAREPTVTTTPAGLATTIEYQGNNITPGTCPFTVDISDATYEGSASGTLTIVATVANAPAAIAATNPITPTGLQTVGNIFKDIVVKTTQDVAAASNGSAKTDAIAARTLALKNLTAAAYTSAKAGIQGPTPLGTLPVADATNYAIMGSKVMQNVTSVDLTLAPQAAEEIVAGVQSQTSTLGKALLAAAATINATKTNASDANAVDNAAEIVIALQAAYPQGTSSVISGADVATLLQGVATSGTIPSQVAIVVANSTNVIDMRDAVEAYYLPMVPDTDYTLLIGGNRISPVVYSAIDQTISVNGTAYAVGSTVPLGFQSVRLYAVGTAGFSNSEPITLTNVTNVASGTSATVSWTVPPLNGVTLGHVVVVITVNGVVQSVANVYSGTSYTLANQAVGAVISFALFMEAEGDESTSASVTSNSVTITNTQTAPCFPKGTPILTPSGYKAVETLEQGELVLTADGRPVPLKLYGRLLPSATERSAPYFIPKGALGPNTPRTDLTLSPDHAFQVRKGVWMLPSKAAELSKKVQQRGINEPVHYFHVECPNYLRDNLVVNGATVESYAGKQLDFVSPYTWSESLKGYTRRGEAATRSKATHAHA